MKIETLITKGTVPDRILLISSVSTWNKIPTWKLAEYTAKTANLPYIENILREDYYH